MYKLFSNDLCYNEVCNFPSMGALLWYLNHGAKPTDPVRVDPSRWLIQHQGQTFEIKKEASRAIYPVINTAPISELIQKWVGEAYLLATDQGARKTARLPHEMTRAAWYATHALGSWEFGAMLMSCGCESNLYLVQEQLGKAFHEKFGYASCGPSYDGHQVNGRHEVHVCYALAYGKPVPAEVVAEYRDDPDLLRFDTPWMQNIFHKPFLWGRYKSVDLLCWLTVLLGGNAHKNIPDRLTEEAMPQIEQAVEALDQNGDGAITIVDVDNALYRAGLLAQRDQPPLPKDEEIGTPNSPFAAKLRLMLGQRRAKSARQQALEKAQKGQMPNRELAWQIAYADSMEKRESASWANRIADAIYNKNLEALLEILDGPGNETSQKAVELEFGIKLRNVTAKQRRRAVFELAGFKDDDAVQREETRLAEKKLQIKARREREEVVERAGSFKIRMDNGDVMTCAQYVDTLIERGFNQVVSRKKGCATNYYLLNPTNNNAYPIGRANGTLEYAQMRLAELQATTEPLADKLAA